MSHILAAFIARGLELVLQILENLGELLWRICISGKFAQGLFDLFRGILLKAMSAHSSLFIRGTALCFFKQGADAANETRQTSQPPALVQIGNGNESFHCILVSLATQVYSPNLLIQGEDDLFQWRARATPIKLRQRALPFSNRMGVGDNVHEEVGGCTGEVIVAKDFLGSGIKAQMSSEVPRAAGIMANSMIQKRFQDGFHW